MTLSFVYPFLGVPLMPDFFLEEFDMNTVQRATDLGAVPKFKDGKVNQQDTPTKTADGGKVAQVSTYTCHPILNLITLCIVSPLHCIPS